MAFSLPFRPRLLDTFRSYTRAGLAADVAAGLTVGIVALSLSMALGIASDQSPGVDVITPIVAGFLIAALSGSKVQIGGPTAAFIPIVPGVSQQYGVENLILCTAMAGVILILMGVALLGTMIKYIPLPVLSGVLIVVALNMGEWRNFARLPGWPRSDAVVFLITFVLTVLDDITVAVEVGTANTRDSVVNPTSERVRHSGRAWRIEMGPDTVQPYRVLLSVLLCFCGLISTRRFRPAGFSGAA